MKIALELTIIKTYNEIMGNTKNEHIDKQHKWLIYLRNQFNHGDMSKEFYEVQLEVHCKTQQR